MCMQKLYTVIMLFVGCIQLVLLLSCCTTTIGHSY
uniref:Uncharacterized protein n=1 Tax=Arundo donax TaxID=35708 RepID=A0A0A8ZUX4_ARUDO